MVQFVAISGLLFVLTSPVVAVDKVIIEHDPDNPLFLKDPILAGMLSVLVPGAGQLYNEENTKATAFFSVAVIGFSIAFDLFDDRRNRDTEDFFWIPSEQLSKRHIDTCSTVDR